ncbi:MAG: acyl-CoA dehydrogenase family protein [Phycisphaeraceae bacterium]
MVAIAVQQKQMKQAEELLFSGPQKLGFAKALFFGRFVHEWVMPYPRLGVEEQVRVDAALAQVRHFIEQSLDPAVIDRLAEIPRATIDELGRLGVLGMTVPEAFGGRGFSQQAYCRVMEAIGGACASTSVFVNAHHSIGMRALLLFGTEEQKERWLPTLATGESLAAFALTEPEAGSDASNVQTTATLSPDGSHFIFNGEKRYITNGCIAQVLTVMARTPAPEKGEGETSVTAFLVTPDMPGFEVVEARMEKLGIRGTATSRLAFHDMRVPRGNVLGPMGKGLKVALTVLDFGRTTFGACCTGAAKACLRMTVDHAKSRRQFQRPLAEFELVQKKIANMAAHIDAMEAMTTVTASLIDRGLEDYMLETAMLKVFTTEALWTIVNDAFQIHGGPAYFTDRPLERMLRDARINQIGEGANDVLRSFVALVGMRGPGEHLRDVWEALHHPLRGAGTVWRFGMERLGGMFHTPDVPVRHGELRPYAKELATLIKRFEASVRRMLIRHGESIFERQLVQERIAEAAMELYASACALSRWDGAFTETAGNGQPPPREHATAEHFLRSSARRVRGHLAALRDNDDDALLAAASAALDA